MSRRIFDFRLPISDLGKYHLRRREGNATEAAASNPLRRSRLAFRSATKNRKSEILAALLFVALAMTGCSHRDPNTLVVYSAGPRGLADWLCAAFEKKSGVRTKLFTATTGEIMAKLMAEQYHPHADVVILASPTAAEVLKAEDMLARLPEGLPARPDWTTPYYAGTAASALGIAMRQDRHDPSLEWSDIFSGKFAGSLIMPSPSQSGTSGEFVIAFHMAMGDTFWNGLKEAKKRGLQISGPNSQALTGLVLRSHDAVLASADYLVFRQIEKGEPLVMHFPASGCPLISRPIAILKDSPVFEHAADFVRFCFTTGAQTRIAAEHLIPADPEVPISPVRQKAGRVTALPFDVAGALREQRKALMRFKYEIEKPAR